jgi:hypothetical protein
LLQPQRRGGTRRFMNRSIVEMRPVFSHAAQLSENDSVFVTAARSARPRADRLAVHVVLVQVRERTLIEPAHSPDRRGPSLQAAGPLPDSFCSSGEPAAFEKATASMHGQVE